MKFKEGDRVRVVEGYMAQYEGELATCIHDSEFDDENKISLLFDNDSLNNHFSDELEKYISANYYYEYQLEYANIANTKINRKLYPKAKVVNEGKELEL